MPQGLMFASELFVSGLLVGLLYAMVALGFVLIYKASDVFNFAQGAMTFLAALALVSVLPTLGWVGALLFAVALMVLLAVVFERLALRRLVGQPHLSLAMATIGLTSVIEGLAQAVWGTEPKGLHLGISPVPLNVGGILVSQGDLVGAAVAAVLVITLVLFFQRTRIGLGLRAVADDHEAALSVGIRLRVTWVLTWALSGIVALAAGILWGSRIGVHFSLSFVVLKALPVLIIGGIDSIPGAIVGGLIVGASENLAEGFIGPLVGGGVQEVFAYLIALIFLIVRPYGLFGRETIERV